MSHLRQVSEIFDANGIEDVLFAPLAERLACDLVQNDASPIDRNLRRARIVIRIGQGRERLPASLTL